MIVDLDSKKTRIVVAGGGTAGWLTALWLKTCYPEIKITVIKSNEIGILGAGEGSTPQLVTFLEEIGVTVVDIIRYAKGTLKNGIKFTNWNGDNKSFFHGFGSALEDFEYHKQFSVNQNLHLSTIALEYISRRENTDLLNLSKIAADKNCAPHIFHPNIKGITSSPTSHFQKLINYSLHFNASLLADLLEKKGRVAGIEVIDAKIQIIKNDENGYITDIALDSGEIVNCDFVFDCTGFKRLFIGEHYKTKFISYKKHLPMKKAAPFFIKMEEDNDTIEPYTEAIAMKYGWIWKIPVQGRYGCGYVYDSDLVKDEDIHKEINEFVGKDTEIPRRFNFEPGMFEKVWVKNCIAVGLASGFVEPLEATSIYHSIIQLRQLITSASGIVYRDEKQIDIFNSYASKTGNDIMSFLHFHYLTNRNDTKFWKDFRKNTSMPASLNQFFENGNRVADIPKLIETGLFDYNSYLQVGSGLQLYNSEDAKKMFMSIVSGSRKTTYIFRKETFLKHLNTVSLGLVDHKSFLDFCY